MKRISRWGNSISFIRYALQALEPGWITIRQIEAWRRTITQYVRHGAKIWVRTFFHKPATIRTTEIHMDLGKGDQLVVSFDQKPYGNEKSLLFTTFCATLYNIFYWGLQDSKRDLHCGGN